MPRPTIPGIAAVVLLALATSAFAGDTFKVLHEFNGTDGVQPTGVAVDASGNLYGTAYSGGRYGYGTAYELIPDGNGSWSKRLIHNFCSTTNCANGGHPWGAMIFDSAGNLYGTTAGVGGLGLEGSIVFQLVRRSDGTWAENVLYSFCALTNCTDGKLPEGSLIFDAFGNLYGATYAGGAYGNGEVFELVAGRNNTWSQKILYSFCPNPAQVCPDGSRPFGNLAFDSSGNLYGTTYFGGQDFPGPCYTNGCGTVFELTPTQGGNWTEQVIFTFDYKDGFGPAALVSDGQGNLYGVTSQGGAGKVFGNGLFFELSPDPGGPWGEAVIHYSRGADMPVGPLAFDSTGNLYGLLYLGGRYGDGAVVKLVPNEDGTWKQAVLHSFNNTAGAAPGGFVLDASGSIYGAARAGGTDGYGLIYEITPQ
jgi:uncharacterized repeat protein (TIGR03803 family)